MGSSPVRKKKVAMRLWAKVTRVINFFLGVLLAFTAYLQEVRTHAIIWVPVFLIPAIITLISAIKPQAAERVEIKAVVSLHIGCCLCLLVYVGTRLVHSMTHEKSIFLMVDSTPEIKNSYNPMNYREGWECLAIFMVVGWLKFLTMTTREHLRETGVTSTEIPPDKMLRTVFAMMAVVTVLGGMYHAESIVPVASRIASLARNAAGVMEDPQPPMFNPVAKPLQERSH